jgi:hypothetical protein
MLPEGVSMLSGDSFFGMPGSLRPAPMLAVGEGNVVLARCTNVVV